VASPDLTTMTEHVLPPEIARHAVDLLDRRGLQVWIFSGQDCLMRRPDGPYIALEERIAFRATVVEDFGVALRAAAKIVGVGGALKFSHGASARCEPRLPQTLLRSRSCWAFRWRKSPSSATAATMSRCLCGAALASRWAMPVRRCSRPRISRLTAMAEKASPTD
jgi:hypothetical protein